MKLKHLLLYGALLLGCINASATIVDGVRQKPTYTTTGFSAELVGQEVYLYNVKAQVFFTQGNNWGTQASVGTEGRKMRFQARDNGGYIVQQYCWRTAEQQGGYMSAAWRDVFFDSENSLFVDRNNQANYYFDVTANGSTFRLSASSENPTFGDYANAGLYVGLKTNSASTVLSPFVDEDEAYVDWAIVTVENYEALAEQVALYNKALELKEWIDKIKAQNGDASTLESVYLDESSTIEQLQTAINSANSLYLKAVVNNAPDKENIDLTMALVNPDFEQGESGWTVKKAANSDGTSSNVRPGGSSTNQCYEAWNNQAFDIYQELPDMPVGVYEIEVQGFYRYGRNNAWNDYLAQSVDYVKPQGVPVYVYLNNNATNFTNIFADPKQITNVSFYSGGSIDYNSQSKEGTTYYFPNGMASAAIAFSDGMYKQSAYGLIANEGDAFRIGVKGNSNQLGDSWVIWDNFKLYYRGFKPEVVQPILETAMADLNQYAGLLMGKTEYAALSKALTDAQTAIDQQNGENMFKALNDLYDVKESVIASKDLFLAQEVPADLANLQNAITDLANARMSVATRAAATTLEAGIKGNTLYEGTEINQLKSDVNATISNLNNSVSLYSQLNDAISSLEAATALKANQALLNEAATLIESAKAGYNDGSIADGEVGEMVDDLYDKATAINNSATAYASLATAITNLQNAIAEASTTEARVAKSTLTKASLRLTASQNLYDNGTIADVDIEDRVTTIGQLIEELTRSTRLYEEFKQALDDLNTALATNEPMSAATRAAAQTVYDTALAAYNEGTVDDDQIEAQKNALNAQIAAIDNSVSKYAELAEAFERLQPVVGKKALQALMDEVDELNAKQADYENGAIADEDIDGIISAIDAIIPQVNASAEKYAELAAAITRLEEGIAVASTDEARVAKSTLTKANLRLTASKNLYDNGTIADADIDARVTTIDQLVDELTHSILLYQEFNTALESLKTTLEENEETPMSAATRAAAQSVYETALAAYNEGTVDDDQIEAQKDALNAQIEAINNSVSKYAELAEAFENLQSVVGKKALQTLMDEVNTLNAKQDDYTAGSIADDEVDGIISSINAIIPQVNASAEKYAELAAAITRLEEGIAVASTDEARVAKSTLTKANLRLTASKNLYDNGTIADADIDARVTTIDQLVDELTHSILLYQEFNTALESLKTTLEENEETPMSAATRAAAQSVYETALAAYNEGTVDDDQIEAQKNALNAQIAAINASVGLYAGLPAPLAQLETALGQKAAQSVIDAATAVFNDAKDGYDARSIADADVENTIASVNAQTSALNTSASQYAQFNTAIGNLQAAITTAQEEGRVSVTMLTNANSKCAGYQTGYENGAENNVPAAIAGINNIIANLSAAAPLYPQASDLTADLTTLGTKLDEADEAIAVAEDVLAQYISSDLREELESAVAEYKETVANAKTDKGTMESQLAGRQLDLTNSESALTGDNAALYSAIGADFNTMSGDIAALIRSLSGIKTTLDEKTENAVAESANKVEIAHNIATFCSVKDLDFTTVENVRAYIVSAFTPSTGDAILTRVYDVPKGTGVVLIGDNGSYEIPAGTGSTVVSNLLVGVNRATVLNQVDGDYTNFILTNGESGEGFYPVEDGSTLAAGKAYLPLPTASLPASGIGNGAAIRFVFEDSGEATYINGLGFGYASSKMEKGVYYNLNGQRVGRPVTGGIYILDGKKILVK